jgi:hypothetical protein
MWLQFLPEPLKIIFGTLGIIVIAGIVAARLFPNVRWLDGFRNKMTEGQKARARQRAAVLTGFEFILLGVVLPMIYFGLTIMFFNTPDPIWLTGIGIASVACIGLGVYILTKASSE